MGLKIPSSVKNVVVRNPLQLRLFLGESAMETCEVIELALAKGFVEEVA